MKRISLISSPSIVLTASLIAGFACNLALMQNAFAIKGTYLPADQMPKGGVCKIVVGKLKNVYTPSYQNGEATGQQPFVDEEPDFTVCSANLISKNTILTAAHCFVGNNEQFVEKGSFRYPKMNKDGSLIAGCGRKDWTRKKECIASASIFGTISSKWEDIRVECPIGAYGENKFEARTITEATGYPHPLFNADNVAESISRSNFDVTVWRTTKPFDQALPLAVEYDDAAQMKALKKNWRTCRSFGYGLNNNDEIAKQNAVNREKIVAGVLPKMDVNGPTSGILLGTYTPITKAHDSLLFSDNSPVPPLTEDEAADDGIRMSEEEIRNQPFIEPGRTDHGDSGGALICKSIDGTDKLFGIVSRGRPVDELGQVGDDGMMRVTETSLFSKISYNKIWIDKVLKEAPLEHSLNSDWWDAFVLPLETQYMFESFSKTNSCVQQHRNEMVRESYKGYNLKIRILQDEYQKALKDNQRYGDQPGFVRTKVRDVLKKSQDVLFECLRGAWFN